MRARPGLSGDHTRERARALARSSEIARVRVLQVLRKRATCCPDVIADRYVCDLHRVWRDSRRLRVRNGAECSAVESIFTRTLSADVPTYNVAPTCCSSCRIRPAPPESLSLSPRYSRRIHDVRTARIADASSGGAGSSQTDVFDSEVAARARAERPVSLGGASSRVPLDRSIDRAVGRSIGRLVGSPCLSLSE